LKEALEANDWTGYGDTDVDDEEGFESTFAAEEAEMNMELFGMKSAIHGEADEEGEADQVDDLEHLMQRMQAIKGISSIFELLR
jgi:hypothetical protein